MSYTPPPPPPLTPAAEKDCLQCRLVSGFGLIGMGAYIYAQSQKRARVGSAAMKALSAGVVCIGGARLMNLNFLKADKGINRVKE